MNDNNRKKKVVENKNGKQEIELKKIPLRKAIFDFGSGIFYCEYCLLELEEVLSVIVANIFNHLVDTVHFRYWNFPVFYVTTYQIT